MVFPKFVTIPLTVKFDVCIYVVSIWNETFSISVSLFVPTIESDESQNVKIKITKLNKNWANGEIVEILEPSSHRVEPFCALQKVCGGCQLQFIDYDYQLELKREIIEDAMKTIEDASKAGVNPLEFMVEYRRLEALLDAKEILEEKSNE